MKIFAAILSSLLLACAIPDKAPAKVFEYVQARIESVPSNYKFPSKECSTNSSALITVDIKISDEGLPLIAKPFDGPPSLFLPAQTFILGCRFHPATLNGVRQPSNFRLKVQFNPSTQTVQVLALSGAVLRPTNTAPRA